MKYDKKNKKFTPPTEGSKEKKYTEEGSPIDWQKHQETCPIYLCNPRRNHKGVCDCPCKCPKHYIGIDYGYDTTNSNAETTRNTGTDDGLSLERQARIVTDPCNVPAPTEPPQSGTLSSELIEQADKYNLDGKVVKNGYAGKLTHINDVPVESREGWEEEFEQMYYEPWGSHPADKLALMISFISRTLHRALENKDRRVVELLEGMKFPGSTPNPGNTEWENGHNTALDEAITRIKQLDS